MSTPVEKIKERLGIVEVVESYIKLDKAGASYKGKCPFHNEKTPSFFVSPDRGAYYCFGCGAKGDIFSFVQAFEGLDFMGALKLLAARAGIPLVYEKPEVKDARERLYTIMEEATRFFEAALHAPAHARALEYIRGRGLTDATIKEFRIGFAVLDWRTLHAHLISKKFTEPELELVGLIKRADDPTRGYYDRFRGRVMFPICDSSGRVIAFSGRILEDDGKSAKYLNSPETPLFTKANVLYGIDKAKADIRKRNYTILVEGQMDLIMSHQAGFKNTVAGSGTALTDTTMNRESVVNNLGIVKRISSNIILVYDNDKAGMNAAQRSAQIALAIGMDVKVGQVPDGLDPADLILKSPDAWKDVLRTAKPVVEFALDRVIAEKLDPRKLPKALSERVLPFIAVLSGNMERAHFIAMIRDRTGIPEDAIRSDLQVIDRAIKAEVRTHSGPTPNQAVAAKVHDKYASIKKAYGLIFWQESLPKPLIDIEHVRTELKRMIPTDVHESLYQSIEASKHELILEAEMVYTGTEMTLAKDILTMLVYIEESLLKEQFADTMRELTAAERAKDDAKALHFFQKCQDLTKRLGDLNKRR